MIIAPEEHEASEGQIARYEAARAALAEARRFEEVHEIRNVAAAMKGYAREARDREMLADAVELQMRAVRRLWELYDYQKTTVGLAAPGRPKIGVADTPISIPTLESLGIDKNLAKRVRAIGAIAADDFEARIDRTRKAVIATAFNGMRVAAERGAHVAAVAPDVIEAIKGTPLDTDNYLGILSKLPVEEQRRRVQDTLLQGQEPEPPPSERHQLALMIAAWERASEWARAEFLGWLRQQQAIQ
jgi:hypothetical protein